MFNILCTQYNGRVSDAAGRQLSDVTISLGCRMKRAAVTSYVTRHHITLHPHNTILSKYCGNPPNNCLRDIHAYWVLEE